MFDPDKLYLKAEKAGEDAADTAYAWGMLEDALDTLEGVIASELKAKGEPVTLISKLIKKDPRWVEMAEQRREAEKQAKIARFKYEQVNRFQDNVRTQEATARRLAT